jgi:hypothetical protein
MAAVISICLPAAASAWTSPLAGYWPLNEGRGQVAYDWSGNGNNGQLGSTPGVDSNDPAWIRGVFGFGSALNFGGDDFIAIRDSDSLEPARITVESWFRGASSPGIRRYLVAKGDDRCIAGSYGLYTGESGGMAFYIYDGTEWVRSPQAPATVWDGRWHHAAGTFDGSTVRLFIDGVEVGTGTPDSGEILYDLPMQDATLGAYRGTCSLLLVGDIDGVRIWSRALPVATIWQQAREILALLRR